MFEHFTEPTRQVVVRAQDEARALRHNYIGTEHLLLGLLREERGVVAPVFECLNVTLEPVRGQVAQIIGQGDETTTGQIPFTPRAKRVLELSRQEALALGHRHIGPEHILLGLARENDGVAARLFSRAGVDAERIRTTVFRELQITPPADYATRMTRGTRSLRAAPQVPVALAVFIAVAVLGIGILVGWAIWG